jgi:hypothetical protein
MQRRTRARASACCCKGGGGRASGGRAAAAAPNTKHATIHNQQPNAHKTQLYVPRLPGVPDFDERLVPERYGFEAEVGRVRVSGRGGWWIRYESGPLFLVHHTSQACAHTTSKPRLQQNKQYKTKTKIK